MNSIFYLFLPRLPAAPDNLQLETVSWVYKDINNELKINNGTITQAAAEAKGYQIAAILAGEDVLFLNAEVPGNNMQRVRQAIPYLLEDSLISDVDELHFSIKRTTENNYDVAVIDKAYFELIINRLNKSGIDADIITVDYLLLANKNTLFYDGVRMLYHGAESCFASDFSILDIDTEVLLEKVQPLKIIQCGESSQSNKQLLDKFPDAKHETCDRTPLFCLLENGSVADGINLLQGEFKKTKKWSEAGKKWLPVAAVFLVWLSLQGGLFIADYVNLSQRNESLNNQINTIYKETFPDSKRIVNAKVQMQQKLSSLQKRQGQNGRSFSAMLTSSATALEKTDGLEIKSLRYYDGRISLELKLASLQALEKLKIELNKNKNYQVEIKSASSTKSDVTAQLQITGGAS